MDNEMAQGRMLKKEISNSEKLGRVKTDKARVLYFMILPHLDIAGRLEANTKRIKGQIVTMLSFSEKMIQSCLEQLYNAGLIVLYENSGEKYLEYTRFGDFQTLNPDKEAKSKIPPPTPEDSRGLQSTPPKFKLKLSKDKISKREYAPLVFLTPEEYKKLTDKFGKAGADERIEELSEGIGSKGYKYQSHYMTILSWARRKAKESGGQQQKTSQEKTIQQKQQNEKQKTKIREEYQPYLEKKTTKALKDLKADAGHLVGLCGWLIDEILAKRKERIRIWK